MGGLRLVLFLVVERSDVAGGQRREGVRDVSLRRHAVVAPSVLAFVLVHSHVHDGLVSCSFLVQVRLRLPRLLRQRLLKFVVGVAFDRLFGGIQRHYSKLCSWCASHH